MNDPTGRLLAIGDIHGCVMPLRRALAEIRPQKNDCLIILGDMINRGPNTREVLDCLLAAQKSTRLVLIEGNHEEELFAARNDSQAYQQWLAMGGDATLESYGPNATLDDIPESHWTLLEECLPYWETEKYFFTHANYEWQTPLEAQTGLYLRWLNLREQTPRPHVSGKIAIVGHTPNLFGNVVDFGFLRCIDTGCGLGGCLTVMEVSSRRIWQFQETEYASMAPRS